MTGRTPFWKNLWQGWLAIAAHFGFVQTMLLLAVIYIVVIGPAWIFTRIGRRDFLAKRELRSGGTAWRDADTAAPDLERAKLLS